MRAQRAQRAEHRDGVAPGLQGLGRVRLVRELDDEHRRREGKDPGRGRGAEAAAARAGARNVPRVLGGPH